LRFGDLLFFPPELLPLAFWLIRMFARRGIERLTDAS
jgi:hypothetical protein